MPISAEELTFRHRTLRPDVALTFTWIPEEHSVRVDFEYCPSEFRHTFTVSSLEALNSLLVEAFEPYDDEVDPYNHVNSILEDFGTYLVNHIGQTLDGWVPIGDAWNCNGLMCRLMYLPENDIYQITYTSYEMPYLGGYGYSYRTIKRVIEEYYNQNPYALTALEENEQEQN